MSEGGTGIFDRLSRIIHRKPEGGPSLPTDSEIAARLDMFLRPETPEENRAAQARADRDGAAIKAYEEKKKADQAEKDSRLRDSDLRTLGDPTNDELRRG